MFSCTYENTASHDVLDTARQLHHTSWGHNGNLVPGSPCLYKESGMQHVQLACMQHLWMMHWLHRTRVTLQWPAQAMRPLKVPEQVLMKIVMPAGHWAGLELVLEPDILAGAVGCPQR